MLYEEWCKPDEICSSDACLNGCGGFWLGRYFHATFPKHFCKKKYSITILEMFAVIVCLKLWGIHFKGKKIQMYCDNQSVCQVINSGKAKCEMLQECLREIAFLAAVNEFQVRMVHLSSETNRISDNLSRWDLDASHRLRFFELVNAYNLTEYEVSDTHFNFNHTW